MNQLCACCQNAQKTPCLFELYERPSGALAEATLAWRCELSETPLGALAQVNRARRSDPAGVGALAEATRSGPVTAPGAALRHRATSAASPPQSRAARSARVKDSQQDCRAGAREAAVPLRRTPLGGANDCRQSRQSCRRGGQEAAVPLRRRVL